jgi:MFS family permease
MYMPTVTSLETPVAASTQVDTSKPDWGQIAPVLLMAGLGFLVDVYDMVLFTLVRIPSLTELGVPAKHILDTGIMLLNVQMVGMVVGGTLWGILGDKKGRRSVLFGSIAMYSITTLLCGFVTSIPMYAILRLLAGIGLAAEGGAAMVIAAEAMPAKYRGYGTGLIAALACLGMSLAGWINNFLAWRTMYIGAGLVGLLLLALRMSMKETAIFTNSLQKQDIKRGSLKLLLSSRRRIATLFKCTFTGAPNWFLIGVLVAFAPEICHDTAHGALINMGSIFIAYGIGETLGEIVCGAGSQLLRSRRKALALFMACSFALTLVILRCSAQMYTLLCLPLGIFGGFWGMTITTTSEQFGTNLRSTGTTLGMNMLRASIIGITTIFGYLATLFGANTAALLTGLFWYGCAAIAIFFTQETFQKDLDFVET